MHTQTKNEKVHYMFFHCSSMMERIFGFYDREIITASLKLINMQISSFLEENKKYN